MKVVAVAIAVGAASWSASALKEAKEYHQPKVAVGAKLFEDLRNAATYAGDMKQVPNPAMMEHDVGATIHEGAIGSIPVISAFTKNDIAINSPGALRAEEANTSVYLEATSRKYLRAQSTMRNQWSKIKTASLLRWLKHTASAKPDELVIMVDSGDVVYGGCSEKQIQTYYQAIVEASNGTEIVASAEVSPYPVQAFDFYNRTAFPWMDERMAAVNRQLDIKADWAADYADCADILGGPCDSPPSYRFLNWGFVMGPAAKLEKMVEFIFKDNNFDQTSAHGYYLEHPGEVTLDYGGVLSMSLHNLAEGDGAPVHFKKGMFGKKTLVNKVSGQTACFVHGNGNGEGFVKSLAAELA